MPVYAFLEKIEDDNRSEGEYFYTETKRHGSCVCYGNDSFNKLQAGMLKRHPSIIMLNRWLFNQHVKTAKIKTKEDTNATDL